MLHEIAAFETNCERGSSYRLLKVYRFKEKKGEAERSSDEGDRKSLNWMENCIAEWKEQKKNVTHLNVRESIV